MYKKDKINNSNEFYIYVHIRHDINKPFYVGKGRKGRYKIKNGRNRFWNNIVNKNNGHFSSYIIYDQLNEYQALIKEREVEIELRNMGYKLVNIMECGSRAGTSNMGHSDYSKSKMRKPISEEQRIKISLSHIGLKNSPETRAKISKANKGKPKHTDEFKEKLGKAISKIVLQYDLEGNFIKEYTSIRQAEIENHPEHIPKSNISSCCTGQQKTAYGYVWKLKK